MKLFIPKEILYRVESKCEKHKSRDYFLPRDLVGPITLFIDERLKKHNERLYDKYKSHRGVDERTLRFAWSTEGKTEDGAIKSLRDLLCFFGFTKNWSDTLLELKIDEKDILNSTKRAKADYQKNGLESTTSIEYGSNINSVYANNIETESKIPMFINRIYIELITRKAAIPIDENDDVIEEIYNSWYELFCIIRDELKLVPVLYLKGQNEDSNAIKLTTEILNEVLRPHLTEHQAKFRNWLRSAKEESRYKKATPQELQKKYPDYKMLMASMKKVNKRLMGFSERLYELY